MSLANFSVGLSTYLLVGAMLFCIGLYGVFAKRNIIAVLMSIELMLNAVNINFVAFNRFIWNEKIDIHYVLTGHTFRDRRSGRRSGGGTGLDHYDLS
ncbi:hypothetical protein JCM17380_34420 [Desulfosporosinus burensis]